VARANAKKTHAGDETPFGGFGHRIAVGIEIAEVYGVKP